METQIPREIIEFYKPYENNTSNIKVQNVLSTSKFEIDSHYTIIDCIGQGAYGIVVAARDSKCEEEDNNLVAIKKIEKAFEHKIFTKRTLRELHLLRLLKHENIIGIKTILLPRSRQKFDDIYVVSELMETDLASIIKSEQPLTDEHCQFFLYQILRGLKYIHSAKVVHRDLKPRNLLVNSNCDLKICDFGLARTIIPGLKCKAGMLTDYVATRWYRAPELLLSWRDYDEKVDVWSVGCIFAELLRRKPFLPGIDTCNQIELIFEYLGTPTDEEISNIPREKFRKLVKNMPKRQPKKFESLFNKASKDAIDLLRKLLTFDFKKRISVDEALKHPYLAELHFPEDEPECPPVSKYDFEFEEHNLNSHQLKDLIYEEILLYHFPNYKKQYETKKASEQSLITHILQNANKYVPDPHSSDEDSDDEE